jgi:acid phosphatase family membrane protein YuiD
MPSSHASTVVFFSYINCNAKRSVVNRICYSNGFFTGIVLYDATGIRRAAGEQAKALNKTS